MVIHTRLRAIVFPLALYAFSACVGGYFVWHASNGERGLKTRIVYKAKIRALEAELSALKSERTEIGRRVALLQANALDRDILDEEAHTVLGRVHKNDLVIMLPKN